MKLKVNYPRSTWIKLLVLSLIFCVYLCCAYLGVIGAIFVGMASDSNAPAALVLALCYLLLLIATVCLIDSTKAWAISLPIQLAVCLIIPLLAKCIHLAPLGGITFFGFLLSSLLDMSYEAYEIFGTLFGFVEVVAIQALGVGIRAPIGVLKKKYGNIPF